MSPESWISIPIDLLLNGVREIRFDVYLRIGADNYAPVFSRTTGIDYKRLAQYHFRGVRELFVREQDRAAWEDFSRRDPVAQLGKPEVSQEEKVTILKNLSDSTLSLVFTQFPFPEAGLERSQQLVRGYIGMLSEQPSVLALLLKIAARGDYSYYHAIATAVFSIYLAKAAGRFGSAEVEEIGLGAFLHDIGKASLPPEVLSKPEQHLTETQKRLMMTHPKLGLDLLSQMPGVTARVRAIVYQHHEQPNGQGYPNALKGEAIAIEARLVRIADAFNSWISKRPGRDALTPEEAFARLENQKAVFDPELAKIFCRLFGAKTAVAA